MIYVDGGSKATQAMMSGDVPIAQVGGNAPVVARLRGADVTLIAGLLNVLAYSMIVSPEIKKPEDLRGKKLSVSRFGSNSDYATRKILLKWGLEAGRRRCGAADSRRSTGANGGNSIQTSSWHGRAAAGDESRAQV